MSIQPEKISIQDAIKYLQEESRSGFSGVKSQKCAEFLRIKSQFKQAADTAYPEFRELYRRLEDSKLLLRNIRKFNGELKSRHVPKAERAKQVEQKLEELAVKISRAQEKAIAIVEKIKWFHGTSSASQPVLSRTGKTLKPTGILLDEGFAPMCGELGAGVLSDGVNQSSLSVGTIALIDMCWNYAFRISNSFSREKFTMDLKGFFQTKLTQLKKYMSQEECNSDLIEMLQLKQWHPKEFQEFCQEHLEEIKQLVSEARQAHFSPKERQVLKMLDYDINRLILAKSDPEARAQVLKDFPEINEKDLLECLNKKEGFCGLNYLKKPYDLSLNYRLYPSIVLLQIVELRTQGFYEYRPLKAHLPIITRTELDSALYQGVNGILNVLLNLDEPSRSASTREEIERALAEYKEGIENLRNEIPPNEEGAADCREQVQMYEALLCTKEELDEALENPEKEMSLLKRFPVLQEKGIRAFLEKPINLRDLFSLPHQTPADQIALTWQIRLHHCHALKNINYSGSNEHFEELLGAPYTVEHYLNKAFRSFLKEGVKSKSRYHERKLARLQKLFEEAPATHFSNEEMDTIEHPYPILIGSTSSPCRSLFQSVIESSIARLEMRISKARYGGEIDIVFVPKVKKAEMKAWLSANGAGQSVRVVSADIISIIQNLPLELIPGKDAVVSGSQLFSKESLERANQLANTVALPPYRTPYPNGCQRKHHGVPHAVRVMLWSILLAELYHEAGRKIDVNPASLIAAAGLHDAARENDGVDMWDRQSGEMAQAALETLQDPHAAFLGKCVAEKDSKEELPLEKKIIHDADCLEIQRCLVSPEDFRMSYLFLHQDLGSELSYELSQEAKEFISLTESPKIKSLLEASEEPLKLLLQILDYAGAAHAKFSLMRRYLYATYKQSGLAKEPNETLKALIQSWEK